MKETKKKSLFKPVERKDTTANLKVVGMNIHIQSISGETILLNKETVRELLREDEKIEKELLRIRNTPVRNHPTIKRQTSGRGWTPDKCPQCGERIYIGLLAGGYCQDKVSLKELGQDKEALKDYNYDEEVGIYWLVKPKNEKLVSKEIEPYYRV